MRTLLVNNISLSHMVNSILDFERLRLQLKRQLLFNRLLSLFRRAEMVTLIWGMLSVTVENTRRRSVHTRRALN